MSVMQRDSKQHTYAEYRTWSDDTRYELIDGIAYLMSPAPSADHQSFVTEIARQVGNALQGKPCRVFVAPIDVRLPRVGAERDDEVDTVVQPDVLVVFDAKKIDAKGIRGAPDWVIEVLSPRTAGHDLIRKRRAYERAGVREYWLVHPVDRVVTIDRLEDGQFGAPDVAETVLSTSVGCLDGVAVDWAPIVARLVGTAE
jgi:Uma2 family endonuclease